MMNPSRRQFLEFLGAVGVQTIISQSPQISWARPASLQSLTPTSSDDVETINGIRAEILISFGDYINPKEDFFGFDNDFISIIPTSKTEAWLWVNHEDCRHITVDELANRFKNKIEFQQKCVGGSLLRLKKISNGWSIDTQSSKNTKIDGASEIPFAWHQPILGQTKAIGTLANCAGGKTPWNTFLTCEENYQNFYGEVEFKNKKRKVIEDGTWTKFLPHPPEHYGWVVEVDPETQKAKKLVALGRFAHEGATVVLAKNGWPVVYSGDDKADECLYKFIAKTKNSLESGTLYVANIEKGEWVALDYDSQPILQKHFANQTDVLIYAREAAKLVGGTPLDRPEDIEQDPLTGHMILALTNNKKKSNLWGSLLKIEEENNDPASLRFKAYTFKAGGPDTGFACPDNICFDPKGNLWFTSDISGSEMNRGPYKEFGNNSLYVIPRGGANAGQVIRIASAPHDAEFTGPCFLPDYSGLLLSVQHPGETSKTINSLTSNWPNNSKIQRPTKPKKTLFTDSFKPKGEAPLLAPQSPSSPTSAVTKQLSNALGLPKPSIIVISGQSLKKILS